MRFTSRAGFLFVLPKIRRRKKIKSKITKGEAEEEDDERKRSLVEKQGYGAGR